MQGEDVFPIPGIMSNFDLCIVPASSRCTWSCMGTSKNKMMLLQAQNVSNILKTMLLPSLLSCPTMSLTLWMSSFSQRWWDHHFCFTSYTAKQCLIVCSCCCADGKDCIWQALWKSALICLMTISQSPCWCMWRCQSNLSWSADPGRQVCQSTAGRCLWAGAELSSEDGRLC